MSGRYLTDLAAVVRTAGLDCIEVGGWQSRARSSGGYSSGRPTHVMAHHTASGPASDGWPDVDYIATGSGDAPLSNLYLNRTGSVWVIAAGATNTNGKGGPLDNVPADSMNSYAVGIEAGNNGTGEPWPTAQQDAYIDLCAALCAAYAIPAGHVRSHAEWAPGRKVDPAGPSRWAPGGTWPMGPFRADVQAALDGTSHAEGETVMVYSPERVDVVAIGADRAVYLRTFWHDSGGWTEWSSLGGDAVSIAACWNGDQFNVFAIGPSGLCYQDAWTAAAGWSGWIDLGAPPGALGAGIGAATRYTPDE